ncbi:hypothetical protein QYE76_049974 [Lolium multiflorum]|uniref:TF-B3 domain-containing protein n=1 Tax=Lolium multiflorum TaxID=4521 RepID=A0AAD8SQ71_LOLMU|nr:hypothetical protein QYE76_049974 [Lolium multiflorum]
MQGKAPRVSYEINGNAYDKPYYLADGIYPDWATLVKTVRNPNFEKTRRFAKMQEACRKDVERGFGVLQARWAIVRHPARTWSLKTMHEVMTCCMIMHNMIVENERSDGRNENHWEFQGELVAPLHGASSWQDYLHINVEVTNENRPRSSRGCGRGDRAGATRPSRSGALPPSSSSEGEWELEFIAVFNGDPLGIRRLSDKFAKFVAGNASAAMQLRGAGCGLCRWPVDVLFDERIKMYLHTSWEKFARFHDLQAGCVLTFAYQGDDEEMSMKVFDDSSCRRHYHNNGEEDDD